MESPKQMVELLKVSSARETTGVPKPNLRAFLHSAATVASPAASLSARMLRSVRASPLHSQNRTRLSQSTGNESLCRFASTPPNVLDAAIWMLLTSSRQRAPAERKYRT